MNRLTVRLYNNVVSLKNVDEFNLDNEITKAIQKLATYEDTELEPEQIDELNKMLLNDQIRHGRALDKLLEYQKLEKQGLLIKIKPIKDFESRYGVDEFGNVYSFNGKYKNTIIRKPYIHKTNGYVYVNLKQNNEVKNMRVHRLVTEAFIPNPNNYPDVNHIDFNKENNCVWNLEWCTKSQNSQHALKNGLLKPPSNVINGVGVNGRNKFIVVTDLINGGSFLENNIKRLTKKLKVGHDFIYYHLKSKEFEFITKNKKYKIQVFLTREEAEKALKEMEGKQ